MALVRTAHETLTCLTCPMYLVKATDFVSMVTWKCHEHWRDRGMLVALDTLQDIYEFQQKRSITFISHQWLGYSFPDTED